MPTGLPIEVRGLTKRFGTVEAVSDLSFTVRPGRVTGFLGPNGAGKTTTLRMLLGLVQPSAGDALIGGRHYRDLTDPLTVVGTSLEASSFHPGRTARNHLQVFADATGIPASRVDHCLSFVGLGDHADRRVGGYSLGMRQRLGLAFALLGDPQVLVLDEPVNGLDPEGIRWIRGMLRELADEGRTVLMSSHLLSEVEQTVDEVVIISRGRLVFEGQLADLDTRGRVIVDAVDRPALLAALTAASLSTEPIDTGFAVMGADAATVGRVAHEAGVPLSRLAEDHDRLESVFLDLIAGGAA